MYQGLGFFKGRILTVKQPPQKPVTENEEVLETQVDENEDDSSE